MLSSVLCVCSDDSLSGSTALGSCLKMGSSSGASRQFGVALRWHLEVSEAAFPATVVHASLEPQHLMALGMCPKQVPATISPRQFQSQISTAQRSCRKPLPSVVLHAMSNLEPRWRWDRVPNTFQQRFRYVSIILRPQRRREWVRIHFPVMVLHVVELVARAAHFLIDCMPLLAGRPSTLAGLQTCQRRPQSSDAIASCVTRPLATSCSMYDHRVSAKEKLCQETASDMLPLLFSSFPSHP